VLNRTSSATGGAVGEQLLGATIDWVVAVSPSQCGRDTGVPVPRFADLPAPVLAKAKNEGYDDNGRKDTGEKLTGATYEGKEYLVQANISGELEAEEVVPHGNASDEKSKAHRRALQLPG
jgi:hypothetical protein